MGEFSCLTDTPGVVRRTHEGVGPAHAQGSLVKALLGRGYLEEGKPQALFTDPPEALACWKAVKAKLAFLRFPRVLA
jgi:hypothetical protein